MTVEQAGPDPTSGDAADLGELVYLRYEQDGLMDLLFCVPEGSSLWKAWMEADAVRMPKEMVDQVINAHHDIVRARDAAVRYLRRTEQSMPRRA